ncbi:MAG: preprotein translocase subunit SecA, partial [Desulfobulbaceae bacterium]|nr:preprotein translocase subunit SecA [Desulfobulbaceae bacterium]
QDQLQAAVDTAYAGREEVNGVEQMRHLERMVLLQMVDTLWKEHLLQMDHLKEGIGLRGYGQKNPLQEYKREGYNLFAGLMQAINQHTVANLMRIQLVREDELARMEEEQRIARERQLEEAKRLNNQAEEATKNKPVKRGEEKIGRNAPCPCGSGKKYKRCCGRQVA